MMIATAAVPRAAAAAAPPSAFGPLKLKRLASFSRAHRVTRAAGCYLHGRFLSAIADMRPALALGMLLSLSLSLSFSLF